MLPFTGLFHRSISQSGTATRPWAVPRKGRPRVLAEQMAGLFVLLTQAKNLSPVSGNRMHANCTMQTVKLK